jgi:hypothetical protein
MAKRTKKNITLGSGKIYCMPYTGTVPEVDTICTEENHLGWIQSGASIEYTMEKHEEKDDLGRVSKIVIIAEEALMKLGLLTWNGQTLTQLTSRGTTKEEGGKRITKIGGSGNGNDVNYVWCFHHEDANDGDLWVVVVGQNQAGFVLTFATDAGTKLEPEIKAIPHDDAGTLIQLIEEIGTT